mgnify:CR=1 FL=1
MRQRDVADESGIVGKVIALKAAFAGEAADAFAVRAPWVLGSCCSRGLGLRAPQPTTATINWCRMGAPGPLHLMFRSCVCVCVCVCVWCVVCECV